jgi:manganese/zinc/iron transport system substrate-binding protein
LINIFLAEAKFMGMKTNPFSIRFLLVLTLLALSAALAQGCAVNNVQAGSADYSGRTIRVTATTGMVADVVKNVGGERVAITTLMGPGVDPHLYKASEGNLHTMDKADVIFYSGLHLEAGLSRIFEHMSRWKRIVAVTDRIDREQLTAPPNFAGNYDPHVWFDVRMWMTAVDVVRDTLIEMDPGSAELYRANADALRDEYAALDEYVREQAQRVPVEKRVLITAHDAFGYFGRAYGFEVRGLQGISTASEAGTGDVQALAAFIADRQIPAVFVESSIPRRNVEAVQAAVRARGFAVNIGGELFSDAMGTAGTPEGTYPGMVRHNIDTIVNALLGSSGADR